MSTLAMMKAAPLASLREDIKIAECRPGFSGILGHTSFAWRWGPLSPFDISGDWDISLELMTPLIDANGVERRAFLNIVGPLNEMADYRIWQPVLVCYPDTELVIEPARSGDA